VWTRRLRLADADPESADLVQAWQTRSTTGTARVEGAAYAGYGCVSFVESLASLERAYDPTKYGQSSERSFAELETPHGRLWVQHVQGPTAAAMITQSCQNLGFRGASAMGPEELEREYGVTGGHLLGGEPTLWQSHWLRNALDAPLPNLHLCGPGTGCGDYSGLNGERCARTIMNAVEALAGR
jgi:phytoene dehydrogenase-like protein